MQDPYVGQITVYPYTFAPNGWATCEGQLLPITQFATLFSLIGTYYGGDGKSHFALPDLRGRVPLGIGQLTGGSLYAIGEAGGGETAPIGIGEMPVHSHAIGASTSAGTINNPANQILAAPFVGGRGGGGSFSAPYNSGTANTTLEPQSLAGSGGNVPHNNIQPSLVFTPCIALRGVFPQRT